MLGVDLRTLRERCDVPMKVAARTIRASVSKLSRLERAESPPDVRDVGDLADLYGVDAEERLRLECLARRATESEWFCRYADGAPSWMRRLIGLEAQAVLLTTFEMKVVPGLLQTAAYAHHISAMGLNRDLTDPLVQQCVALRKERQQRVFGQAEPPQSVFLLDESILHRVVGNREIMREQMLRMRELLDEPYIAIRIVPFHGTVVSNYGSVTHLRFALQGLPPLVYIEGNDDATYHTKQEEVERHVTLLLRLSEEAAETTRDSRAMLDKAVARFSD
ncbi:helix-turn-helix domain-containing protein [Streptomyces griseofuscus]|uniref:helix-turn-helix domain-containing protein n=1 Tax=Streptomyces TaxID=1883 RepID=UPI002278BC1D|nr:helix-turn-helix transcriptional regulator [Streptomyces sp. CRPSP2-6A1]